MARKPRRKGPEIHQSIKEALGYEEYQTDDEVYSDWKERTSRVCKPCWELKYCPYGPLVEQSPLLPIEADEGNAHLEYLKQCLETGLVGQYSAIGDEEKARYSTWLANDEILIEQAHYQFKSEQEILRASQQEDDLAKVHDWIGGPLPSIEKYRVPFEQFSSDGLDEFSEEEWLKIEPIIDQLRKKYEDAISTGFIDNRSPLEPARRAFFELSIQQIEGKDRPKSIPDVFKEASCNVFGHICPVYFTAEDITETQQARRMGRRKLDYQTMIRIVRRDNYTCQICDKKLDDKEVEFDHIIPVSKGGSSEEHNIRLTCYDCNRDKSDKFTP